MRKLFATPEEEKQVTLVVAGVFAHAMFMSAREQSSAKEVIDTSFDAAMHFMARANELLR